jgi:hypothetical protein
VYTIATRPGPLVSAFSHVQEQCKCHADNDSEQGSVQGANGVVVRYPWLVLAVAATTVPRLGRPAVTADASDCVMGGPFVRA